MAANESPTVGDVFELLNRWRHLPFYSLETRAAPFFAVFLRDILRAKFGTEMHETVIPEFPLRFGALDKNDLRHPNLSYKVDYVAFRKDKSAKDSTAYLVELKTDMGSKRPEQDEYLCKAQDIEFSLLVRGVRELAKASKSKRKYVHLLHQLSLAGLVSRNDKLDELYRKSLSQCRVPGWTEAINNLKMGDTTCSKPKVVFIQPTEDKSDKPWFKYIYFKDVAKAVKDKGELGEHFAKSLEQWIETAGSRDPRYVPPSA